MEKNNDYIKPSVMTSPAKEGQSYSGIMRTGEDNPADRTKWEKLKIRMGDIKSNFEKKVKT